MDRVDVHPVEAHPRRPGKMLAPARERSGKKGEKVIEGHKLWSVGGTAKRAAAARARPRLVPDAAGARRKLSVCFIGRGIYDIA